MQNLVVLTGAGISVESGLNTFRAEDGLWEQHSIQDVATLAGWRTNPKLVLDFYNQRRRDVQKAKPNLAHKLLAKLQNHYRVTILTQNIDDLHERAGSGKIIHLHGEVLKMRSETDKNLVESITTNMQLGTKSPNGSLWRPFIVWFGEAVPLYDTAIKHIKTADVFLVIGTSLQVSPVSYLVDFPKASCKSYYLDPSANEVVLNNFVGIAKPATKAMEQVFTQLTD